MLILGMIRENNTAGWIGCAGQVPHLNGEQSSQRWGPGTLPALTFLGASPIGVRARVRGILCVSSGSALFCPVKIVRVILSEEANVPVLKATVELSCQRSKRAQIEWLQLFILCLFVKVLVNSNKHIVG